MNHNPKASVTKDHHPSRKCKWLVRHYSEFNVHTGKWKRKSKSFATKKLADHYASEITYKFRNNIQTNTPITAMSIRKPSITRLSVLSG